MTVAAVRTALASITITDLDCFPYIPDTIDPPCMGVGRMLLKYDTAFRGLVEYEVTLHVFASRADSWQGQDDLSAYMEPTGSSSIKAALESDKTLGGACQTLRVESVEGPGLVDVGGTQFWSSSWTVRVWA